MRFLTGVWGGTRMNLLVITQMYSQPDDMGDNKPTKTVNYFVKYQKGLRRNMPIEFLLWCHRQDPERN